MRPGDVGLRQIESDLPGRPLRPNRGERAPGHQEMAGTMIKANHGVGAGRDIDQLCVSDELQIAAGGRRNDAAPLIDQAEQFRYGLPDARPATPLCPPSAGSVGELGIDRTHEIAGDAGDHLRKLNRFGDVMDEVDQNSEVHQQQRFRDGDRQMGHEVARGSLVIEPSASTA